MTHSLNEIEALCKRAARGAGLPWGLAEDAGKAARRLCAMALPGADLLAKELRRIDGISLTDLTPISLRDPVWRGPAGELSPLTTGPALSDAAHHLTAQNALELENLHCPLLIVPFLSDAARRIGQGLALSWADGRGLTNGHTLQIDGNILAEPHPTRCQVSIYDAQITPRALTHRATPSADVLDQLTRLAHRTYAPATDQSRALGAGAGETDND